MPKVAKELVALEVRRLSGAGFYPVGGVAGLNLRITQTGNGRNWILRTMIDGKRCDIGLGPYPEVSLADARTEAARLKKEIREGRNPIKERMAKNQARLDERNRRISFDKATADYISIHEKTWRNPKHRQQWRNTLADYASPVIGNKAVAEIALKDVLAVLEPIWQEKTETAKRLQGRIEKILDWCIVKGYCSGENPARWKHHLDKIMPAPNKVAKKGNFPALAYSEIAGFMQQLATMEGTAARALEFTIYTACRSGETRSLEWADIDLKAAVWLAPAAKTKTGQDHEKPLCRGAMAILEAIPESERSGLVFKGRGGAEQSDATLAAVLKRMNQQREQAGLPLWIDAKQDNRPVTVHGFRSTFRDWLGDTTNYDRDIGELALGHQIENKVEAAYRRGQMLEKRKQMMADWYEYTQGGGNE